MREDELSGLLRRASEISTETEEILTNDPEMAMIAHSAEEAGLPREAVLQALRERLAERNNLFKANEIVLAGSADGMFYAALVKGTEGGTVKVRFFQGGDAFVPATAIQPFSAIPGSKFQFFTDALGMWTTGRLTRFNEDSRTATFECWGTEYTVPLDKVRMDTRPNTSHWKWLTNPRSVAFIIGVTVAAFAILMMVVTKIPR